MQDMGIVEGSAEQAIPMIINDDNVYIHEDIETYTEKDERTEEDITKYRYHEYIYSRNEYIQILADQRDEMMEALAELGSLVSEVTA